ncbi:hypothetical protein Tco_0702094 [Tanacetum coccineum]|uniref:Uncharacterized protein n=1 Tax=Tanacetum coccineum TaxID=301880 RepID=A0ABQ4XUZ7_9ASTR
MKKIFQRLPLGRGMDILSYGYAFWINQCTSGFHGLEEPGGSRGSFEVGVGATEEGKVVLVGDEGCETTRGDVGVSLCKDLVMLLLGYSFLPQMGFHTPFWLPLDGLDVGLLERCHCEECDE